MSRRDPGVNAPDRLVRVGLYLVILACIVASGDILVSVAHDAGWTDWRAFLLPFLIDLPGFLGGRIWLRKAATTAETRSYARRLTLAALATSILGNAIGHLVRSGYLTPGIGLVLVCSIVAPLVLWAVLHLDALLTPDGVPARAKAAPVPVVVSTGDAAAASSKPSPSPSSKAKREPVSDDLLLQRARHADQEHRAEHGRPISRDALKKALGISSARASGVHGRLKAEAEVA